jgi:hypothetical protein
VNGHPHAARARGAEANEDRALKHLLWLAVVGLIAGCASRPPASDQFAQTRDSTCYTVDIFDKIIVKTPEAGVPKEWRGFAGRWGGGAWNGAWCHDLYVLDIASSGAATVIETHAPMPAWGKPASAFRRTAHIDKDGRLRMNFGRVKVEYWLDGDTLYGKRDEGMGEMLVALSRRAL